MKNEAPFSNFSVKLILELNLPFKYLYINKIKYNYSNLISTLSKKSTMKKFLFNTMIITNIFLSSTLIKAQQWYDISGGANIRTNFIEAISSDSNGNVYVAGAYFENSNSYVVTWDGTNWSQLGDFSGRMGEVSCLTTDKNGDVFVAGNFTNSENYYYVNRWNGTTWTELGGINGLKANNTINILIADDQGYIYITGDFTNENGAYYIAKWDGTAWSEINVPNLDDPIKVMTTDRMGNIYVGGNIKSKINDSQNIYKWNGTTWSEIGSGTNMKVFNSNTFFSSIGVTPSGYIYVGTDGKDLNDKYYISQWDGTSWNQLPVEKDGYASFVHVDYNGNVYAPFVERKDNNEKNNIKRWNGTTWNQVANLDVNNSIDVMYSDKKGNLFVAGYFTNKYSNRFVATLNNASSPLSVVRGTYADNNIKIYPNPSQDIVNIDVPADLIGTSYYIYDSKAILHSSGIIAAGSTTLNIDNLSTGLYFIKLGELSKNAFKLVKK